MIYEFAMVRIRWPRGDWHLHVHLRDAGNQPIGCGHDLRLHLISVDKDQDRPRRHRERRPADAAFLFRRQALQGQGSLARVNGCPPKTFGAG